MDSFRWSERNGADAMIVVMTATPTKPADSYLGLLFCMEDMALCVRAPSSWSAVRTKDWGAYTP